MRWTLHLTAEVPCGSCGILIPPGTPIALLMAGRVRPGDPLKLCGLPRCEVCVGQLADPVEIDLERFRLEREAADAAAPPAVLPAPRYRHVPHRRPMTAAAAMADSFDPKLAAAHDWEKR
jgi:hypothetical protein